MLIFFRLYMSYKNHINIFLLPNTNNNTNKSSRKMNYYQTPYVRQVRYNSPDSTTIHSKQYECGKGQVMTSFIGTDS